MSKLKTLLEGISVENLVKQIILNRKKYILIFASALLVAEVLAWVYVHAPRAEKKILLSPPIGVDSDLVWARFAPYLQNDSQKDLPKIRYKHVQRSPGDIRRLLTLSVQSFSGNAQKMSEALDQYWENRLTERYLKSLGLTILENQLSLRAIQDPLTIREKMRVIQEQLPYYQRLIQDKAPLAPLWQFRAMETNEKQNYFIPVEYHVNALRLELADLQRELDYFKNNQTRNSQIQEAIDEVTSNTAYLALLTRKVNEAQGKDDSLWKELRDYALSYRSYLIENRSPAVPIQRKDAKIIYTEVFVVILLISILSLFLLAWKRKDEEVPEN